MKRSLIAVVLAAPRHRRVRRANAPGRREPRAKRPATTYIADTRAWTRSFTAHP
jgi:hypothetical protein